MDRIEFSKRINTIMLSEGLSEKERNEKMYPITEAISQMMPKRLFRYRPCDESQPVKIEMQFDAFEKDNIYAVTADKFNDPYDTLVRYDLKSIRNYVNSLLSIDSLLQIRKLVEQEKDFSESIKSNYPKEFVEEVKKQILTSDFNSMGEMVENYKKDILQSIDSYYPKFAEASRMTATIACFCESVQSIAMWSHYAFNHHGFALEYNFRPTLTKNLKYCGLFPVIYDDIRYDASLLMTILFIKSLGCNISNPDSLSHIKCCLHKATIWDYEKEWRLLDYSPRYDYFEEKSTVIHYKPSAIYYGVKMPIYIKERLHKIAQEKGINEYEMFIDDASPQYEMLYRRLTEIIS